MNIPKLCYLIVTKEETKVSIEALELCMDTIDYKMSLAELDHGYDDMYYCELGSEYTKYETMLTNLEAVMKYNEDK